MRVKNNSGQIDTWCGQELAIGQEFDIPAQDLHKWQGDDKVINDVTSLNLQVGDSYSYKQTSSEAINYFLNKDDLALDSEKAQIVRLKQAPSGWTYQLKCFEITTSKLNSLYDKDSEGGDSAEITVKYFDGSDVEITDPLNSAQIVRTILEFEPTWDYELIGGSAKIKTTPTNDVRLWVVAVPDLAAPTGSKVMIKGANFKYFTSNSSVEADGRVSKRMNYDVTYHTNKLKFIIKHGAGEEHDIMFALEFYKL